MKFNGSGFDKSRLLEIYQSLLLPRQIEEKMLIYLRQGKISKWFSGYGQEAISVGCTMALDPDEYIMTMHRNLGVFTSRNIPLERLFAQFQGKAQGFTKGRDRSFHFGSNAHHIVGMISHLGAQLGVADGIALAEKLKSSNKVVLAFTGDGGASEGDFHEALNVAAVWDLPVIFVVENNQWGLSTPSSEQFRCKQFIDKGIGYGMEAVQVDGNNVLEVIQAVEKIKSNILKKPAPVLLECKTFRMRGHEEASGTKYYPMGIQDEWAVKDPISNFEAYLVSENILNESTIDKLKSEMTSMISAKFDEALQLPEIEFNTEEEFGDLYRKTEAKMVARGAATQEKRFVDAIADAVNEAMIRHPELVLMGQDIAEYGGVFKVTDKLAARYGRDRVRNTPICESAIVGAALGLSIKGNKAMVEMQFADFVTCGFNQIVNNLAKVHWRWGQSADVVIRMPTGAGVGAGPFHSQSNEAWFTHTPGLKVVYPSSPAEAKGLLLAAFQDPNPVLFFEHKYLYRSLSEQVPDGYYTDELGVANVVREGDALTIVTYGLGVHWAKEEAEASSMSIEILDLRTLLPYDFEAIKRSVMKTGKVLVLHEDVLTGGLGADIAARISEELFEFLDAPVRRCASLDTPIPFAPELERNFLANARLKKAIESLIEY
ncbi:MAG: dehydrogenase E1 component subunit alpha/beta [Flavobacteriales bacterium]|nr:dehydrogenase E1 component subunit alpha/beta [Flavobacteriales bacterium]